MTNRIYNFSAGPATLPESVLEKASSALLDFAGTGIGIAEISHRSSQFDEVIKGAEANLRELLNISDDYSVLFLQGGASLQFSMIPMNLLTEGTQANYIISGSWAKKALQEASKFGATHVAASSEKNSFTSIPQNCQCSDNPAYLHFTSNNTIAGTQFSTEPECSDAPLICDSSSDILHKKIDVSKYGLIYAGAQKNLGPSGVTLVIIRKDLLKRSEDSLPVLMNYNTQASKDSLYNTPPTFAIYVVGEVFKWIKEQGGMAGIEEKNRKKAALLYDALDGTDFYYGTAEKESRSLMNVTFRLQNSELEPVLIKEATENGFSGLKGHRSVGGLRASIYNAFPEKGIEELIKFMKEFENKH